MSAYCCVKLDLFINKQVTSLYFEDCMIHLNTDCVGNGECLILQRLWGLNYNYCLEKEDFEFIVLINAFKFVVQRGRH